MSEKDYAPLSIACVRGLCDKIYEKRKFAGAEIEKMVKDFSDANNTNQIKKLIRVLGQDLMASTNPNVKNGALMGLSSVAVGLGKGCTNFLPDLIHPIIACLSESESRVRYQATEALFNVVKIARAGALDHFPAVFNALARLVADPEPQVKQGAELLDRLVKDIVTESSRVELSQLVPLVRERVYSRSGGVRQFVVSWLAVLDAVPDVDLVPHLPDLLDGLFQMLDDPNPEIRRMCDVQLNEFLRSIKKDPSRVDFQAMINTLIIHAQSAEELLQLTAITWIKEFVDLAGAGMLPHASGVLLAVLPCLAYCDEPRKSIRETATTVNLQLQLTDFIAYETESSPPREVTGSQEAGAEDKAESSESREKASGDERGEEKPGEQAGLQLDAVVGVVTQMVHHSSVHTRAAALEWLVRLYTRLPARMAAHSEPVLAAVLPSLADGADGVVRRALAVVAEICSCRDRDRDHTGEPEPSGYFHQFLQALLRLLATRAGLLEDRGAFVVRQLCVLLSAEHVYRALAAILLRERDLDFVATMVDVLNTILLTSAELYDLRLQLRNFNTPATCSLFTALYACWCHSPVSLLALCLLTHNYQHCNTLINTFGDLEITVDFLTEVDKLVQLIESPIFAYLRLELLDPEVAPPLRNALFGVLMLLPQSDAFHTLRKRLHCAPPHHHTQTSGSGSGSSSRHGQHSGSSVDFSALLQQFRDAQAAQRDFRRRERARLAREEHDND